MYTLFYLKAGCFYAVSGVRNAHLQNDSVAECCFLYSTPVASNNGENCKKIFKKLVLT